MSEIVQQIADVAAELADPHPHMERVRTGWTPQRNPIFTTHTTIQPGLITQLYEAVTPGNTEQEGARPTPRSRPPLALDALSAHTVITLAAAQWCWRLHLPQQSTVEANVRKLVGARYDHDQAHTLLGEMRRWRTMCAVMTGWEHVRRLDGVPCPGVDCGRTGTLRVNLTAKRAYCVSQDRDEQGALVCGAYWEEDTLGLLGEYIRATTEGAAA